MPHTLSSAEVAEFVEDSLQQDPELTWRDLSSRFGVSEGYLLNMLDEADRLDLTHLIHGDQPDPAPAPAAPLGPRPRQLNREDVSWMSRAACVGEPLGIFYPEEIRSPAKREQTTAYAKSICASCPVRAECLVDALAVETQDPVSDGPHGIRGGLTRAERRPLLASLRQQEGKEHLS